MKEGGKKTTKLWIIIIGTSFLTFLVRYLPQTILHEKKLPFFVEQLLTYLPLGVLAAIATQSVFLREGKLYSGLPDFYLLGAIASIITALVIRNLGLVIIAGVGIVALATFITKLLG